MLLALSFKTQRQVIKEGMPDRMDALRAAFMMTKQDNQRLQRDLARTKARYERMAAQQASGIRSARGLEQALTEAKLLAGTVAVRGPGVVVTIHDSPKLDPSETRKDVIENYLAHDYDIQNVTNELFGAGAEAISINGQRLVANSSIRCVGAAVMVNSVRIAPPFIIKAIGDPSALEKALTTPGGAADGLILLDMIEIKKSNSITVPAYTGSSPIFRSQPVTSPSGKSR